MDRNFSLGQGVDDLHKLSQIAGSKQQLFETRHFSCAHSVSSWLISILCAHCYFGFQNLTRKKSDRRVIDSVAHDEEALMQITAIHVVKHNW